MEQVILFRIKSKNWKKTSIKKTIIYIGNPIIGDQKYFLNKK